MEYIRICLSFFSLGIFCALMLQLILINKSLGMHGVYLRRSLLASDLWLATKPFNYVSLIIVYINLPLVSLRRRYFPSAGPNAYTSGSVTIRATNSSEYSNTRAFFIDGGTQILLMMIGPCLYIKLT